MAISLCALPYAVDALQPHISADTLTEHHDKHHKAYVDKTNKLIEGTDLADQALEAVIKAAKGNAGLFNAAAQTWNHGFYWQSMSPNKTKPSAELAAAIDAAFGSIDKLAEELAKCGNDHFASGWAWLVASDGKLAITDTHDAETALTGKANPLLVVDVWEHAYYLDRKSKRAEYTKAVTSDLLNWDFASENFSRGTAWTYPA